MIKVIFASLISLFAVSALAAPAQYSGFECRFERDPNGAWYLSGGVWSNYETELGFNQLHMQSHWMMGLKDTGYFGGGCSGLQATANNPSLIVNWVDGADLDLGLNLGCTFSGDKIRLTSEGKIWNGQDDYFASRHTFHSPDGKAWEFLIAVGMKAVRGADLQACMDILKKETGQQSAATRIESPFKFKSRVLK